MAARALACVADVLGCMAEGRGGLRSGPAANPEWIQSFSYLECGDLVRGVEALAQEREKWLSRWVLISRNPLRSHPGKDLLMVGTQRAGVQIDQDPQFAAPCNRLSPLLSGLPCWFELPAIMRGLSRS